MTTPQQPALAYVVKRYPRFSEPFIVNEILEHEKAGMRIHIFALRPVRESLFQDILAQVRAPVTEVDPFFRQFGGKFKVGLCHS